MIKFTLPKIAAEQKREIFNQRQAAEYIGISVPTLRAYSRSGLIPCNRIGKRYIYAREALQEMAKERRKNHNEG